MNIDRSPRGSKKHSGRVLKKLQGTYHVKTDGETVVCSISSKLRKQLVYPTADPSSLRPVVQDVLDIRVVDPLAIGDWVSFVVSKTGKGMITEVYPRKNKLTRKAPGAKPLEQIIASNIDQAVVVVAVAKLRLKWSLVDRYLIDAEALDIPSVICVTKVDLVTIEESFRKELEVYERMGYPVVTTSVITGVGIDQLKEHFKDKVSVLVGKSGVGKTSLLNAIQPELGLRIREVSGATSKGKHTTSHLEMFELDIGGGVIDTPGMREFGLWKAEQLDIAYLFREMRPYVGKCKFGINCSHTHEPDCSIKNAVEMGKVTERRYRSYLSLR